MSKEEKKSVALYFVETANERDCKRILTDLVRERQVETDVMLNQLEKHHVIQINDYPRTQHK